MNTNTYKTFFFKIILSLFCSLALSIGTFSQVDFVMKFEGKVKDDNGKVMSGATVKIFQNGKEVNSIITDAKGGFKTKSFYYGPLYKIVISKGNHTVNNFEINSRNYDEERLQAEVVVPIKAELFEKKEDVNYSIVENKPIEKFAINKVTGQITDDANYYNNRKSEIKAYFKKLEGDAKNKEKQFNSLKKSGDDAFAKKDYGKAIDEWKKALNIKEDAPLAEKLTDAEIKYEDILEAKEKKRKMMKIIKEGYAMVALLKFENAKEKYEAAESLLPKNKIPKDKLKELQIKIDNQGEAKKEKKYKELISRAQIKINSESFDEAKTLLAQAQKILPKNKIVPSKLKEIDKIIKNLAEKKAKEEAAAKKKAEEEAEAKKKAEEEAEAKKKAEEEAAAKKKAEEEAAAKKKAEEDAAAKKKAKEETEAKKKAEEEAAAKKKAEEEAAAKKKAEEKARLEAEALAKLTAEKNAAEKARLNLEALARQKAEEEAKEKARLEAEALAKLNAEKNAAEKARLNSEALAKKKAEKEAKRKANELASKEALAEAKREREKKYTSLITKAKNQFNENDYVSAKNTYNSALNIKPNEAFPKQRISTINSILNKLAQEKRNSIESTDDYFNIDANLYGTEVDMSGDDGTFLLTKIEDNSDRRKYMELKRYIDSTVSNNKNSDLRDTDFSQLTYQKFEELSDKIAKNIGSNDYGRNGSMTSISLYLNAYTEDTKNQNKVATKNSLANYEALDRLNDQYSDINTDLAIRNNGLGGEYQRYADNNAELMKIKSLNHLKTNEETFSEIEELKDKLAKENRYKQITEKEKDAQYIKYNELIFDKNKELAEKEQISQKFEIDYLESTVEILKEKRENGNEKIGTHNNEYIEYTESVADVTSGLQKSSSAKIATTNEEIGELKEKIASETATNQGRVKQFSEEYNILNDRLVTRSNELADADKESQKRINTEIDKINDNLVENAVSGDEQIKENIKLLVDYIEERVDAQKIQKKENGEKSLESDKEITKIKDNLFVQKSDEIKNELALLFPEGVTQKVYQTKNDFGEITSITVRRVVVVGNKGDDYMYKKSKSGSYYFKNGKSISESTWDLETSGTILQ